MRLSDLFEKMANQARFAPSELEFLRLAGNEIQIRNQQIAGNINEKNEIDVFFPFNLLFQETLTQNTASVTIQMPGKYNHLMMFFNGRSDNGGTGNDYITAQFNGDTGSNYDYQILEGSGATVSASRTTGTTFTVLGALAQNGNAAGVSVSSFALINNYLSTYNKNVLAWKGIGGGHITSISGRWGNISSINQVVIGANGANILAGTIISMYGVL